MKSFASNMRQLPVLLLILAVLAGCDTMKNDGDDSSSGGTGSPGEAVGDSLALFDQQRLDVGALHVTLDSTGALTGGQWYPDPSSEEAIGVIFSAGLWLAGEQEGQQRANLVWLGTYPYSNYTIQLDTTLGGIYHVTPDSLDRDIANWPADLGAPVDAQGEPDLYGSAMAWAALTTDEDVTEGVHAAPLQQVRVTQALYAYDRTEARYAEYGLEDAVFVRYDVTNLSEQPIIDAYAGFHIDIDLSIPRGTDLDCTNAGWNNTGYFVDRALSYTYDVKYRGDQNDTDCQVPVAGITLLESPTGTAPEEVVTSHRIMRKNNYYDPAFGEYAMTSPAHVMNALQGLSATGEPMVNPVTDEETLFAFTGDPVEETGWLDTDDGVDVRSLLTAGPFTLEPGETETLTVMIVAKRGAVLSEALERLTQTVDDARRIAQNGALD